MMKNNGLKRMFVILAVTFLTLVGLSCQFISGEQAVDYKKEITDYPESVQTEEFNLADTGIEEATTATEATEESTTNEETTTATEATEETVTNEETTADETGEDEPESGEELEEETVTALPEQTEGLTIEKSIIGFTALLSNEAVVNDYSELKSALANDNGITTVYFGSNITMQAGIRINPNKVNVVIDGFNPLEPEQSEPYTLAGYSSSSFTDTIYINEAGTKTLHVRDLKITGKNYYGPFSVYDSSSLAGVVITYERVNYNGPQLGYHRKGALHFKDCTVSIHGGNGGSANEEFSEAKYLKFEGMNTIDTATSTNSIFWIPAGGTFEIANDSSLVLTSPNTSTTYGVFYADGSSYKIDISIGKRAVLDATIAGVVAPDSYVTLNSFTVREGGAFYLRTTKTTTGPVLKMGGALTVEKDAKFIISGYGSASYAVLRQETGDITVGKDATFQITADSAYTTLLNLIGRAFICNDPASVLLYNANRDILASTSVGRLYVNAQQVNYWNTLSTGSLNNPPLYMWDKADKTNFLVDGTLATGSIGNFTSLSSNYNTGDSPGVAPTAATFSMVNAQVLAFGRLELTVIAPTTNSTTISGFTAPGATVRASFTQQGIYYTFSDVTADSAGVFHVPIDVALNEATVITVKSSWQYLTTTAEAVVGGEGNLEFFVPEFMEFFETELTSYTKIVSRLHPNWEIVVSDARGSGSGWRIYARLDSEMTPNSVNLPTLDGALIYVDGFGNSTVMSTDTEILILEHTSTDDEEVFPVSWDDDKGVLLIVRQGTVFTNTVYSASITWSLVDGP